MPIIGAILVWLTDCLVQLAAGQGGQRVPTGAQALQFAAHASRWPHVIFKRRTCARLLMRIA